MKKYLSWSGGKDSTASLILCHEYGKNLDGVIISEVMFDHARNISGENPEQIKWIYETAIPIIKNVFGYEVIVVKDKSDYIREFYHIIKNSPTPERNGKCAGFFVGGACRGNTLKTRPIREFYKSIQGEYEQIVGIAIDEPNRLERLLKHSNRRSVLAEYGITEAQTYDICRKYNLLSLLYERRCRIGCWFCPNARLKELADTKKKYPELWNELEIMNKCSNKVSNNFRYGQTFEQVNREIDLINNQISIFDIMEDKQ